MQFNPTPIARHVNIPSVLYLQEPHRLFYEAPNDLWTHPARDATVKGAVRRAVDLLEVAHARRQVAEDLANASALDGILVDSFSSAESVNRAYDLVGRACYVRPDSRLWRVEPRATQQVTLVGIGTIAPYMRVDFVIDPVAASGVADCKLHWIGNAAYPGYAANLVAQAKKLGVDVTLHVATSGSATLDVLPEASLLAYAPPLEPFGFAPLEFGAAGVPTVAVAEGGVRETVVDGLNGLLTNRDPGEMVQAIRTLVQADRVRVSLSANARKLGGGRWNLEATLDRLQGELARVLLVHGNGART